MSVASSATLRVGFNLVYFRPGGVGGSETYVKQIGSRLAAFPEAELTAFCAPSVAKDLDLQGARIVTLGKEEDYSLTSRLWAENVGLARHVAQIDVLFSPGGYAAAWLPSRIPQVVTIHDLELFHFPEHLARSKRLQRRIMLAATLKRASRLITVSDYTRDDVLDRYGLVPSRLTTIHHGFESPANVETHQESEIQEKFKLTRPFFFYPADDQPKKNREMLVGAFSELLRTSDVEIDLVFAGQTGPGVTALERRIRSLGLSDRIRHLGWLEYVDILALMQAATALVFPSRFEGFGLPLLEAMACRTPVLASRSGSIPEIAGSAALFVDASDPEGWTAGMNRLLTSPGLRTELVERGLENLTRFSWDRAALQTLDVLSQSTRGPRSGEHTTS